MTRATFLRALRSCALSGALAGVSVAVLGPGAVAAAADGAPPAAAIERIGGQARSATVGTRYAQPLRVRVLDADGNPLEGASVTFALGSAGSAASASAGAAFADGSAQATVMTDAAGRATSPAFTANTTAGAFSAGATLTGGAGHVSFSLRNRAARPAALAPGVAASTWAAVGARFPIRLAVTVTDAYGNPVSGAVVTFSAPARGPSGRFASGSRRVRVRAGASGTAVAPAFHATSRPGGYVVRATAGAAAPAAFALVNEAPAPSR
jgi:hypothetical protein